MCLERKAMSSIEEGGLKMGIRSPLSREDLDCGKAGAPPARRLESRSDSGVNHV